MGWPLDDAAKSPRPKRDRRDRPVHCNQNHTGRQSWEKGSGASDRTAHHRPEDNAKHYIKSSTLAHETLVAKTNDHNCHKEDNKSAKRHPPDAEIPGLKPQPQRPIDICPDLVK